MSSILNNLTPEQLEVLRARAREKLQQRANQANQSNNQAKQPNKKPNKPKKEQSQADILTKGVIRLDVKNRVADKKRETKLNIYRANKEQEVIKTNIVESTREQLATHFNKLKAEKQGFKEADKLKKKYAKKLLEMEKETIAYKERLETPLEEYANLLAKEELEKKERAKKRNFLLKTVFTLGYHAYKEGKKEIFLRTGGVE